MNDHATNRESKQSVRRRKPLRVIVALVAVIMVVCVAVTCFDAGELWPLALLYYGPIIFFIGCCILLPVVLAFRYKQ